MTLLISANDIKKSLPMNDAIDAMRDAFGQLAMGQTHMPLRSHINLLPDDGDNLVMPSFMPSTGRVLRYQEPEQKGSGELVVDSGVYEGGEVSMFYDPMIAKISTHAPTRDQSIEIMRAALNDTIIRGIAHNISFLDAILAHERFQKGDISTNFIEQEYPAGFIGATIDSEAKRVYMAVAVFCYLRDLERAAAISGQLPGRERAIGQRWVVNIMNNDYPVYTRRRDHGYDIGFDDGLIVIRSSWKLGNKLFQGTVNGMPISVKTQRLPEGYQLGFAGYDVRVVVRSPKVSELAQYMPDLDDSASELELRAPIAGLITKMHVKEGDTVRAGDPLMVLEAMKMENIIYADNDSTIEKIHVKPPESVSADDLIMEFAVAEQEAA